VPLVASGTNFGARGKQSALAIVIEEAIEVREVRRDIMRRARMTMAALVALQLLAVPVMIEAKTCGNGIINPGEQCDGTADSGCPGMCNAKCQCPPVKTFTLTSKAKPPDSPGTKGVKVTNPNLIEQFGKSFNLNKARYTRFQLDRAQAKPDAILILIPGFEGAAGNFRILAQNLLQRIHADHGKRLEVWAFDRRTHWLQDNAGLKVAQKHLDPELGENWLFGTELGLAIDPRLPRRRRAVFYNPQDDIPFLANWTNLVFSQDIDAVVTAALKKARNKNVFLGGHSAGTAFTARYASTDFDITGTCNGIPQPGYAKLRGLVLLEGGGGSTGGPPLTGDSLDRIVAQADGGLFGAVRDNAPRCVDGTTPCTIATEAAACAGQTPPKCTLPTTAYAVVQGLLNPRVFAQAEPAAIQSVTDLNTGQIITQASGTQAAEPDLASLGFIPPATVEASFGTFLYKHGLIASAVAPFVAMSVGEPGPVVNTTGSGVCKSGTCTVFNVGATCSTNTDCSQAIMLLTWIDILNPLLTLGPNLGPPPTTLSNPLPRWGADKEVTRLDRVLWAFFAGQTNFTDWYYPNAGPSTTTVSGVCASGTCTVGNLGSTCSTNTDCSQAINLDSRQLSAPVPAGRARCDIENLTQAGNINIPVIGFSASQGLATVPGAYTAFAQSIGTCMAPSCDGTTTRVVDATSPNPAFPTFGDVAGGFQVFVNEGFAHLDVLTAEDNADNNVIGPLSDFIARNIQ
jgi:pimeloyl-ACP methyl ester carboxylesterase